MLTTQQVREALRQVTGPTGGGDIVSSGMISDILIRDGTVSFAIELDTSINAEVEPVRAAAEKAISALDGVERATVVLTNKEPIASAPSPKFR